MDKIIDEIEFYEQHLKEAKSRLYEILHAQEKQKPKIISQMITEKWSAYHGDCIEIIKGIPSESIHYSIFSPPFSNLFVYSASIRDMGNSTDEEFYDHFQFLIPELYRVLMPGRLVSLHCSDIPAMKERDGYIGMKDFPSALRSEFERIGFIYHGKSLIWKDPLLEAVRTKALGLAHKQIIKDSAMCRPGTPDYILTMRKPGENPEPISRKRGFERYIGEKKEPTAKKQNDPKKNKYSHFVWQRYASPVWMDIRQSNTLNIKQAREKDDERHICLASGSLILTRKEGYIPIENIKIGDLVLTHKGRWMPVIRKRCNGIKSTILICAQGVADLQITPDHKIWFRSPIGKGRWPGMKGSPFKEKLSAMKNDPEWIPACDTKGGYVNLKLPPIEYSPLTSDEWWIVGRWLGDGHKGGHRYSGKREGLGQFLISCSHSECESLIKHLGKYVGHVAKCDTVSQIALKGLRSEVRDVLARSGNGALNKKIPGEAVALSLEKSKALLSGYLSADGCYVKKYDRWVASSVSRSLLLGMALIAQRAKGVVASVYAGRPGGKGVIQGRTVDTLQDWIFGFRDSEGYRKSGWIGEDGAWKKVRKIEKGGISKVWDISVSEDASFTAEGAIVKNCPLQLDAIARCLELWTNPNDIVLSPFAGIGSEGYEAVRMGRKAILIELKKSYYDLSVKYMKQAERLNQAEGFGF